ncbi:hypothetical protein OS493_028257 [Desmophyllum pertusum]|uniref:Uncharacterized protein n=1 Tax=Desmophyllum pertusum TaxID=174260 RepID=A0A9W9YNC3_9CNID|nr:hypothetical protein OS493_028257 [Desmophyllum pertusum]
MLDDGKEMGECCKCKDCFHKDCVQADFSTKTCMCTKCEDTTRQTNGRSICNVCKRNPKSNRTETDAGPSAIDGAIPMEEILSTTSDIVKGTTCCICAFGSSTVALNQPPQARYTPTPSRTHRTTEMV